MIVPVFQGRALVMARSRYADFYRADFHVTNNQVYDVLGLIFFGYL